MTQFCYDAKVEEKVSKNLMKLVLRAPNFPLFGHMASSSNLLSAEELHNFEMDHDAYYKKMEQVGNMASLYP